MKRRFYTILSFLTVVLSVTVAYGNEIDSRFEQTVWTGTYAMSSGHEGSLQMNFRGERYFSFSLPDEETGYQYTGQVSSANRVGGQWVIMVEILEEVYEGFDINTNRPFHKKAAIAGSFVVSLKGQWLKATPGSQSRLEGTMSFMGDSRNVRWFLDKTGRFQLETKSGDTRRN